MNNPSAAVIKTRIVMLEQQTSNMETNLKQGFYDLRKKLTIGKIVKETLSDFKNTPGLKSSLFSTLLHLGLSFVGGKMLLGKGNILKKAIGGALHIGAGKLLGNRVGIMKRFASNLFSKKMGFRTPPEIKTIEKSPTRRLRT